MALGYKCRETVAIQLTDFDGNFSSHHQFFEVYLYSPMSYGCRHTLYAFSECSLRSFRSVSTCAISHITVVSVVTSLGCELQIPPCRSSLSFLIFVSFVLL
jgi:hypothetical protein